MRFYLHVYLILSPLLTLIFLSWNLFYHEFLGIQYHANEQVLDFIQNIMDCGQRNCMNIVDSKKVTTETLLDPSGNVIIVQLILSISALRHATDAPCLWATMPMCMGLNPRFSLVRKFCLSSFVCYYNIQISHTIATFLCMMIWVFRSTVQIIHKHTQNKCTRGE